MKRFFQHGKKETSILAMSGSRKRGRNYQRINFPGLRNFSRRYNMPPRKISNPRCPRCERRVTQVFDRIIKGKRVVRCFSCAKELGWFDDEPEQGRLFE